MLDLEIRKEISERVDAIQPVLIETLKEQIAIPSVVSYEAGEYPFGIKVHEAFVHFLKTAEDMGFVVKNVDEYGGHVEFGSGEEMACIIGHLDVVPAGDGWNHGAFNPTVLNGRLYGRGAIDDKGPMVAALYAMKVLKDMGFKPGKLIRLIIGLDEEVEWKGMDRYFETERKPDVGFTPDAMFPVIRGEKGIIVCKLAKKFTKGNNSGLMISKLSGGSAPNMVADSCRAVLRCKNRDRYAEVIDMVNAFKSQGIEISAKKQGTSLIVTTKGVSAHGSNPAAGENAIAHMMKFLSEVSLDAVDQSEFVKFFNRHIGYELNGESLGISMKDDESGELVLNVGMCEISMEEAILSINIRYPVTKTEEDVFDKMENTVKPYGVGIIKGKTQKPIYYEADHSLVKLFMDVYRRNTEDTKSESLVIGGGTYARCTDNILAFGANFPGAEETEHQPNEYVDIEKLMLATKMYAEAIYELAV